LNRNLLEARGSRVLSWRGWLRCLGEIRKAKRREISC
jgi:hypothetical protein